MSLDALKAQTAEIVDAMRADLLGLSHAIHETPELAFEEVEAARRLTAGVEANDLAVQRQACGIETAYAAEFGPKDRPVIAILSEYDALPGIGHACGHNVIAAAGFGAAMALAKLGATLPGRVRYLGTPAEERFGGKEYMARAGAFDGVDAAMMVHPASVELVTMPCLAVAEVDVTFHGLPAHAAAMPHRGVNALDAAISAYQAIAQLRQHIQQSERIHGIITEGGLAPNIVPDRAALRYYVRAADGIALAKLKARVEACFLAGAMGAGARAEIVWGEADLLDLKTSWPMARAYEANATALGRSFFPMEKLAPGLAGSTDMGNVSHRVPSIHPMVQVAPHDIVIHNPEFARHAASPKADQAVLDGAKAMAMTALDLMMRPDLLSEAKADFAATQDASARAIAEAFKPHDSGYAHRFGLCGCRHGH